MPSTHIFSRSKGASRALRLFGALGFAFAGISAAAQTSVSAINAGSSTAVGSFTADTTCTAGQRYDPNQTVSIPSGISSIAAPEKVYESACQGNLTYTLDGLISGNTYSVVLHFAELYFNAAGSREFNVAINGTPVSSLQNFDVFKAAGNARYTAVVETVPGIVAANGRITLSFTRGAVDQPSINGIQIETATDSGSCTRLAATPTGLSASAASSSSIALLWTAAVAPSNCTVTYNLYGSQLSGFTPSASNLLVSTATTSYVNSGLSASTPYYYILEAVDGEGASAPSAQQSATTQSSGSGAGPATEIVAIQAGGPGVSNAAGGDASFSADEFFSGGGTAPSGNAVDVSSVTNAAPGAVYQTERNGGQFSYIIPGLRPSAPYTVLLHFAETYFPAVGDRVFNVFVNTSTASTPTIPNLDIYALVGANKALVKTVSTNADSSGKITVNFAGGSANQPKIDGLEVRGAASACTLTPSSAPSGLTALATSPSIIGLTWTGVNQPPNCPITYSLYRSTTPGFTPSASTLVAKSLSSPSYSDTGLSPSITYYYVVEATDSFGASGASQQASAETHSATSCVSIPATAPGGLLATASTSTAIEVSWTPIATPSYCTNVRYNVYGSSVSNFTPSLSNQIAKNITGVTFINTGLVPSSNYYYVVQATDEDGASPLFSASRTATTLAPPTTLTAAASSANEIDLSFPASVAPSPVEYHIYRGTNATFTPSSSNLVGSTKSNFYNDVVLSASTTYFYRVQASDPSGTTTVGGPVSAATLAAAPDTPPFWDASNVPALPAGDVITIKFLNRTNGQYPDAQVFWSATVGGVTTTKSIAAQPTFSMPANASGRIYFYLGAVNQNTNNYWDFLEYTLGATFINMNSTRVDAFGLKYAFQLTCGDGTNIAIGETSNTFAEDRASTFQRYLAAVPANFQTLARLQAPFRIVSPSAGGFDTGGPYQTYYNDWISQLWAANGITIPLAIPNGDGLGSYPDLSAAIYRHVGATPGTFNSNGTLKSQALWGNPDTFYQTTPFSYYAQFLHANAINGQQYAFPYDDAGGYSGDVGCQTPKTLLVAIGW